MSDRPNEIEPILAALEQRVTLAVERIRELTTENRRLKAVGGRAEAGAPEGRAFATLENRIAELDRERLGLLADRRALTQRVEEILARLEYLESETVTN
ncbi:MAG: hypothetical protein SGI90_12480 [Candidatus Eisenbacteria bacterium]|nr:hypothetical protein [Candidatus Eisenbacteria bacterium]